MTQNTHIRAFATYQMFGDHPGPKWFDIVFPPRVADGTIAAARHVATYPMCFGIVLVTFTVDFPIDQVPETYSEGVEWATAQINRIIHDSDVEVLAMFATHQGDIDDDQVIRHAALSYLHGEDHPNTNLGRLADALGEDRDTVEALG